MLLTVDIGNTNITLGVFEGKKLHVTFRMTTIQTRTSDDCNSHKILSLARLPVPTLPHVSY